MYQEIDSLVKLVSSLNLSFGHSSILFTGCGVRRHLFNWVDIKFKKQRKHNERLQVALVWAVVLF